MTAFYRGWTIRPDYRPGRDPSDLRADRLGVVLSTGTLDKLQCMIDTRIRNTPISRGLQTMSTERRNEQEIDFYQGGTRESDVPPAPDEGRRTILFPYWAHNPVKDTVEEMGVWCYSREAFELLVSEWNAGRNVDGIVYYETDPRSTAPDEAPSCPHSVCSQHYIDTGLPECVVLTDARRTVGEALDRYNATMETDNADAQEPPIAFPETPEVTLDEAQLVREVLTWAEARGISTLTEAAAALRDRLETGTPDAPDNFEEGVVYSVEITVSRWEDGTIVESDVDESITLGPLTRDENEAFQNLDRIVWDLEV